MIQKAPHITGLTSPEVEKLNSRKEKFKFPVRSDRTYSQIIRTNVLNIYNIILIFSAFIVVILGGNKDVLFAIGLVLLNTGIGLFQEIKAKKILDQLATLYTNLVKVRRNNQSISIPPNALVKGEIIEITPGESIVADGRVLFSDSLEVDESSLTGESESISKTKGDYLISGSYCLAGFGLMEAEKVGNKTSLYELTIKSKGFRTVLTNSEKWLKRLFQILLFITLLLSPLTLINGINRGLPLSQTLADVVNLIGSLIPQGMIISMTILFAYGAIVIGKYRTLIQRVNSIAAMGTITVMCADKTGTLTTNQLTLEKIIPLNKNTLPQVNNYLYLFTNYISWANKTVRAIVDKLARNQQKQLKNSQYNKIAEAAFTSERKWSGISFKNLTLILGTPERITNDKETIDHAKRLAASGFRVLVLAKSQQTITPEKLLPKNRTEVALLVFQEQLRPDVLETLDLLAKQHIRVKIISGDNIDTLLSLAGKLNLNTSYAYDQNDLENIKAENFSTKVKQGQFFARITPSMKERIISELISQGETVAMIGDGINDVEALKKSHIAIAVNDGAQITKDVSDMILLNNAFTTLPKAIEEGRDITQRIYAIAKIFFVKVIYLITLFLLAGFAGFTFPISIRQTTWLGFIVVGIPTALISFKVLDPIHTKNLQRDLIRYTLVAGIVGGFFMALIMIIAQLVFGETIESSRTQVSLFAALYSTYILFQIHGINPFVLRSIKQNAVSFIIISLIGVVAILLPSKLAPDIFHFYPLDSIDWLILSFGIAISLMLLRYIIKKIRIIELLKRTFSY